MAENVTQSELDKLNSTAKTAAASSDETKTYEGKFIGTLIGQATTAQELAKPYNFTLSGDVTGSASVNAGDLIMPVTVNHSAHADTSDFAGKTQLANRSNVADMANTAEFAYRAGKIAKIIINLTGVVTGKGESTNSESVDIEVTDFDASKQFVVGALATEPDTSKVYIDVTGKHLWIYDNTGAVWVDVFDTLAKELASHGLRLDALEALNAGDRLTSLEGRANVLEKAKVNHEQRITTNEETLVQHNTRITTNADNVTALTTRIESIEEVNTTQTASIADHEKRINNMETSSDVGQFATRIQAVEDKNIEQDKNIKANTDSIAVNTKAIADETKARQEADNTLSQSVQNEIQPKIDTLTTGLAKEIEDRKSADTALSTSVSETIQPKIDEVSSKLTQEIEDRTTAVSNLTSTVTSNKTATDESISTLNQKFAGLIDLVYPVGSIYLSVNNVSPQTFLGGTWEALQDRFLIGASATYPVNTTGGSASHTLTVAEMPAHTHAFQGSSIGAHVHTITRVVTGSGPAAGWDNLENIKFQNHYQVRATTPITTDASGASAASGSVASTGSGSAHSILNPYLAVYMWKRTA